MALLPSDPQQTKKLALVALPLLALFAYYYFLHGKRAEEITRLETHLEALEEQNSKARALAAHGGPELEKKLALYEEHMRRLEELIPSREEVPELLHAMTQQAREAGVDLALMRPESEAPVPDTGGSFYTRQSYQMGVLGPYAGVGRFLASIGSLPRIITPLDVKMKPTTDGQKDGQQALQTTFRIQTFVIPVASSDSVSAPADATQNGKTPNART